MKRIFILALLLFTLLTLLGCSNTSTVSVMDSYKNLKEENLKYNIEQISFSKSFQSLDAGIEIIENDKNTIKILAQLGLGDYTDVKIHKISMDKNNIDIHVSGSRKDKKSDLSVPQVIINLDKEKFKNMEIDDLKFNIIYKDYEPTKIKFGINDVLNKLESHFKISSNSSARFNLINTGKNILWEISYNSVFYRDMEDTPLMDLYALVDSNTGEILESSKDIISSVLDSGHILNYIQNKNLLYKQVYTDDENSKNKENLYIYDIENKEKTLIYNSNYTISSGQISPDINHVSFIEASTNGNEVYIASYDNPKVYKVVFEANFNPHIIKWKDKDVLYIMGNKDDNSFLYTYDSSNNELDLVNKINKDIEDFSSFHNYFLLVERSEDKDNKKTHLTKDWKEFKSSNTGFNSKLIDNKNIVYITKDQQSHVDYLSIYNFEEKEIVRRIDRNVVSYSIFQDNIIYIKNNPSYNDYTIYSYSIENKEKSLISNAICRDVYYNNNDNVLYINTTLPFENHKTEMIYSIDLNHSKNPKDI